MSDVEYQMLDLGPAMNTEQTLFQSTKYLCYFKFLMFSSQDMSGYITLQRYLVHMIIFLLITNFLPHLG